MSRYGKREPGQIWGAIIVMACLGLYAWLNSMLLDSRVSELDLLFNDFKTKPEQERIKLANSDELYEKLITLYNSRSWSIRKWDVRRAHDSYVSELKKQADFDLDKYARMHSEELENLSEQNTSMKNDPMHVPDISGIYPVDENGNPDVDKIAQDIFAAPDLGSYQKEYCRRWAKFQSYASRTQAYPEMYKLPNCNE